MTSPDSNSHHIISLPKPKGSKSNHFSFFFLKPNEYLERHWPQNNNKRDVYQSPLEGGGWIMEDRIDSIATSRIESIAKSHF
jgi:hypothetical protein